MKKSKFTEEQIAFALHQAQTGVSVEEVCRKIGVSQATFYAWKRKYAGVGVTELRRLRQLEEENRKLKQLVADLSVSAGVILTHRRCGRFLGRFIRISNLEPDDTRWGCGGQATV